MSNKLKNIFSDEEIIFNGKINFKNHESYEDFMKALETVQEEGKLVQVKGIDSIETTVCNGEEIYPVDEHENICEFFVAPPTEEVPFELETDYGKKVLKLKKYHINKGIVLQTDEKAIVFLKLLFEFNSTKTKISYHAQPENAKSVAEIIENYSMILALFNNLFRQDINKIEDGITVKNMREYFESALVGFKKLQFVEEEFGVRFDPKILSQSEEDWIEVEELYLTLKEKKIIRLNAKINDFETMGMKVNQQEENIKVGSELDITFSVNMEFSLWNNNISIHSACLLSNAIAKEISKESDKETKILYGSEDSRPMYISYSGFKTEEEADEELKHIMNRKEEYANALTVRGHINKKISENKKM